MIELDAQQFLGIDLGDRDMLKRRTWRWLRLRIIGLVASTPGSRLQQRFLPKRTPVTLYPPRSIIQGFRDPE